MMDLHLTMVRVGGQDVARVSGPASAEDVCNGIVALVVMLLRLLDKEGFTRREALDIVKKVFASGLTMEPEFQHIRRVDPDGGGE